MKFWKDITGCLFSALPMPEPYKSRKCDEQTWRCQFGSDFTIADRLMVVFCNAFLFDTEERFKFRPEDSVTSIYAAKYPKVKWYSAECPDIMEQTSLIENLENEFAIAFDNADNRLEKIETFLQIVKEIKVAQQSTAPLPRDPAGHSDGEC